MSKTLRLLFALFSFFLFIGPASAGSSIPISMMSNNKGLVSVPIDKVVDVVRHQIVNLSPRDYSEAKVQIIYDKSTNPEYLLVYLLSAKNYTFTIQRININSEYEVMSVQNDYQLSAKDFAQQPNLSLTQQNVCPDENVQFVTATPAERIQTAVRAIEYVFAQSGVYGYKAKKLVGNDATVAAYESYLTCPKLLGFYSVGHGSPQGILLADGVLSSTLVSQVLKYKLHQKVVVLFNSCKVHNDPLKSSMTEDAQSQKYIGGVTNLKIGPSEGASRCFWDTAFNHQRMTAAIDFCNREFDPRDIFGISGHGSDLFGVIA